MRVATCRSRQTATLDRDRSCRFESQAALPPFPSRLVTNGRAWACLGKAHHTRESCTHVLQIQSGTCGREPVMSSALERGRPWSFPCWLSLRIETRYHQPSTSSAYLLDSNNSQSTHYCS